VDVQSFSACLNARFTPDSDGDYQFGLTSAGLSRLFLNGLLVVDNWSLWTPGNSYFGAGSKEAIATARLQAGETYDLTVEYSGQATGDLGVKGVRVGVTKPLDDADMERAVQLAAASDVALLCVGLNGEWDTEGQDRPHIDLVGRQNELIERVAAVNPKTVVVLQTGGPVTMPWLDKVASVLQAWYPGQECGNAIADVLFGVVNPAGRLPQTFPRCVEDNPAFVNYPGEYGKVRYGEGTFVGYRYYHKKLIEVLFPFGYGLSYTTFRYDDLRLSAEHMTPDDTLRVSVDVSNTGTRAPAKKLCSSTCRIRRRVWSDRRMN
jgi:beta-glucosidase